MSKTMNTTTKFNDKKTVLLSKKGMKELRKTIAQLEHDLQAISRRLRDSDKTNGHDDRFERNELLSRYEALRSELSDKQRTLSQAKLLPTKRARMRVAVGSVVDLIDQQGKLFQYTIVESVEANPIDGRISKLSPLGSSLVGKTVKDVIEWSNGSRHAKYQLIKIS